MTSPLKFSINRMSAPTLTYNDFLALSQRLGVQAIEIRNDVKGIEITNGANAHEVGKAAKAAGLTIRSINALQRFEQFDDERAQEAQALIDYAQACGAEAIVLCPTNDTQDPRSSEQKHIDLVHALTALQPMLNAANLIGLIEPLGFVECAVRRKSQAVAAMTEIDQAEQTFALVHDTFHHHLAGEDMFFPQLTGLIHISGVEDESLSADRMRDGHRVLVGAKDRLGNVEQLKKLRAEGYDGYVSYEPFAAEVAHSANIEQELSDSIEFLNAAV